MRRTLSLVPVFLAACISCGGNESEGNPGRGTGAPGGGAGNAGTGGGAGTSGVPGGSGGASAGAGASASGGAGAGGAAGSGTAAGGSGGGGIDGCLGSTGLSVTALTTTRIAEMGTPFDPSEEDDVNPFDWNTNYGKSPEIVALPDGDEIDILWQDQAQRKAFVVHVADSGTGYAVTQAFELELLDRIMGFARDEAGNYYYATGVDEDGDLDQGGQIYPVPGEHRCDIVRVVKFGPDGVPSLQIDVDLARGEADSESELIINPMVAASSRLAYSGGQLALVHGINTDRDDGGVRHQKALTTHFDATTGAVTRTSSMWVSHSFDQRMFWDGEGFVELHLGDAYPRAIALGRFLAASGTDTYELFRPKGPTGENSTFTRLGGIAPIAQGDDGYLVVFTTDRGADLPTEDWQTLVGTRDLAFLRVARDFDQADPDDADFVAPGAAVLSVQSGGDDVDNPLTWLTDYAGEAAQADRPRVAALGDDSFVVLWERWNGASGDASSFAGTHALVLNGEGTIVQAAQKVSDLHLSRGDDAVSVGGRALFVTGDATNQRLVLNFVSSALEYEAVELP